MRGDIQDFEKLRAACDGVDAMIHLAAISDEADFHYVGLNEEMLRLFLEQAGFVEIVRVSGFGLFDDTSNLVYKLPISLNMTARKPR